MLVWHQINQRTAVSPLWSVITPSLAGPILRPIMPDTTPLAALRTGFACNDFSRALDLRFKHADGLHLTPVLGGFLTRHYAALRQPGNLVISISLNRHCYLIRRYNQFAELARWLAASDDFASDILLRRHHNKSQAGISRIQQQKMSPVYSL